MSDDLLIRQQIARLVDGGQSAADFEDWLQEFAYELETEPARSLAHDALRVLTEHANGDWEDEEVLDQLGALSRTYWFVGALTMIQSGAESGLVSHDRRLAATGRSPVAECA